MVQLLVLDLTEEQQAILDDVRRQIFAQNLVKVS
jgi:hypothetical protein